MADRLGSALKRVAATILLVIAVLVGAWSAGEAVRAQAPAPRARFAYLVLYQGWNLIAPAGNTDLSFAATLVKALYAYPPGAVAYQQAGLRDVTPGLGYWAYVADPRGGSIVLDLSGQDSVALDLPAGSCALIGNPSTKGSARVHGADRVYVYSNLLNRYIATTLLGVGQGGLACNDAASAEVVTIAFEGDVSVPDWPSCCSPRPLNLGGRSQVVFKNDSPAPLTVAFRNMDRAGNLTSEDPEVLLGAIEACSDCIAYPPGAQPRPPCSDAATTYSFTVPPGAYHLVIHADVPEQPDTIADVAVLPNTVYTVCYQIAGD
jgi:hypothetical protein